MKKFYSISIHGELANILQIEKKESFYNVIAKEIIEITKLPVYLKEKHSFYIVVTLDEIIDDIVTVPDVITNKELLKNFLLKQFKESLPTKNILLNYHKISENKEESTITYKVDAIANEEYIRLLSSIPDWKEIQGATINKFALLGMTKKCYGNDGKNGYFSVFTHSETVTILAIDPNNDLLFGRTTPNVPSDSALSLDIADEVIQTVAYVKQKFRSINFDTLIISGTLSLDESMAERLLLSTELSVATMYPNTFIKGLMHEEPQHYIITLGSFLVQKNDMFLPKKVYSLKQYEIVTKGLMLTATLALVTSAYIAYDAYSRYNDSLERYENIKTRLLRMVKRTNTYSLQELEKSYEQLEIAKKYLRHHPSDILLKLRTLIELLPPSRYTYNDEDTKEAKFTLFFEKKFEHLSDLYKFQKEFISRFKKIDNNTSMKYTDKTDYTDMNFKAEITNAKQESPRRIRRRRR